MRKTYTLDKLGYSLELGKYAKQATGAAWLRHGGTVVLATVVDAKSSEFPGFLPLTVDYREQFSAVGEIPGGYLKREGKWTDNEVLTARLIDRAIRPFFHPRYFNQVQVCISLFSYDHEHSPAVLAFLAASIALNISKIPFLEPLGLAEVARVNGQWIANPLHADEVASDAIVTAAGTKDGVCMVEACSGQISEEELMQALKMAHETIKEQIAWQELIVREGGVKKDAPALAADWDVWEKRAREFLTRERVESVFKNNKIERSEALSHVQESFFAQHPGELEKGSDALNEIEYLFDAILKEKTTDLVFELGRRVDGRAFDQVRTIASEVGLLPQVHASALFTRGSTQALTSVTLGSAQDAQRMETLAEGEINKRFILHYNFPPFSVGEVRPMRGPSRRDLGHGNLASSALEHILPEKIAFPYTMRIVTDILESDGSSSMATVCAATLAMLDGGVPVKDMVSGVAMGLLKSSQDKFQALTDINGFEDAFGLMDFKVAGTDKGITAIQMDIKYKAGLPWHALEVALEQARSGRMHILSEMRKVLSAPRTELSPLVPKIVSFQISTEKIGAIIGTGGKTIREICEKTKTTIDIESDGTVNIFAVKGADIDMAQRWVQVLAGRINAGDKFKGVVSRVAEFGIFVDLVPGFAGLVHVSALPREKQHAMATDFPIGLGVEVEVMDYDPSTGRIRLRFQHIGQAPSPAPDHRPRFHKK